MMCKTINKRAIPNLTMVFFIDARAMKKEKEKSV